MKQGGSHRSKQDQTEGRHRIGIDIYRSLMGQSSPQGQWPGDLLRSGRPRDTSRARSLPESCSRLWSRGQSQVGPEYVNIFARGIGEKKPSSKRSMTRH